MRVSDVIKERLPRTIVLFLTATVLSFYLGFALGKIIAWKRGSLVEHTATIGGVTLYTMFTPFVALMVMWLFAFKLGWFPIGKFLDPRIWSDNSIEANAIFNRMIATALVIGLVTFAAYMAARKTRFRWKRWAGPAAFAASVVICVGVWSASGAGYLAVDIVKHMVLPVITLTLLSFASTMLLTRTSMLETMREDFVTAARAKGLSESQVRDRHVARNAMLPVVTSFIFSMAFAIDGGIVIEAIFSWPGMGMTLVESVRSEDVPLAVGAFAFIGVFALAAHLVADIVYVYLDPRIRY
jgi:peptide/nickel transport system permease protein